MMQSSPSPFVVRATIIASLGGILFGYDMGVVSGALPQLTKAFDLSRSQQETVVSILYLGGGLGASLGGLICDALGRRQAIIVTDVIFTGGAAVLYFASSVTEVMIGRIVVGFGVAVSGIADVAYLHEIAPVEWRGSIVSVNEACISLGFLLAYVAGYILSVLDPDNGWRAMFGLSAVIAMFQLIGIWGMPESPSWLKDRGFTHESEIALRTIHGERYTPAEPAVPSPIVRRKPYKYGTESSGNEETTPSPLLKEMNARSKRFGCCSGIVSDIHKAIGTFRRTCMDHKRQAIIAAFLSIAQQFSGQANVLNYAPTILGQIGLSSGEDDTALGPTLLIGAVKFVATVIVILKIETVGRRFLLLTGMITICVGLVLLTLFFAGFFHKAIGTMCALAGLLGVVIGYSASFGPLTWLFTSELFPTKIRGRILGLSTILTYLCAAFVTNTFLTGQALIGTSNVFAFYGVVTFLGSIFAYLAIPDTGGKNDEEIEGAIMSMWLWRKPPQVDKPSGEKTSLNV